MAAVLMPITRCRYACVLIVVATFMGVALATPVQSERDDLSVDDYDNLLDLLLPRNPNGIYAFAVRLMPSFRLESQLVVSFQDPSQVHAEFSQVTGKAAWDALLDQLDADQPSTLAELASSIKVDKHAIDVDLATAQRWQDSLLKASRVSIDDLQRRTLARRRSRTETVFVTADGTLGELWYSDRDRGVKLSWGPLTIPESGEKFKPEWHVPLARWMREVMDAAEERVRREQPR
jgi:hypothetical protein